MLTSEELDELIERSNSCDFHFRSEAKLLESLQELKERRGKGINELVKQVHENAANHGWWEQERSFGELIALCHSELSEALEEYRNGHPVNKDIGLPIKYYSGGGYNATLPTKCCTKPEGIAIELADTVIRIMDICGKYGIDLEAAILEKHEYNKTRPYKHGGKVI